MEPKTRCPTQGDAGGGDSPTDALDQHRVPSAQLAAGEQHAMGGQPGSGQTGRFDKGQRSRFGDQICLRDDHLVGEGALVTFAEDGATRVQGLIPRPGRVIDHGVYDDLVAVLVDTCRVAAKDHGESFLAQSHTAK